MRINEDYLDNISDDEMEEVSPEDTRELQYSFRIVSRNDNSKHLNSEDGFRKSLLTLVRKTPNVIEYKITSIRLPAKKEKDGISIMPRIVMHESSMDFIAEFQMDIKKFSSLSSLWRFMHMMHDTVRYNDYDSVELYL